MKLRKLNPWPIAVTALVLIGLAVRVYAAWTLQYRPNSDHGLVALMAKHMAEGRDFPVFFYGQPYMGSLEPFASAVLIWLFGPTPFMVCLGVALTGVVLLPLIYVYGRDADSPLAGVLAVVYALVGSRVVLYFSVAPRGGYMTMMVFGFAAVWAACRIATRLHAGHGVSRWAYAALGFLAGAGWWSNQLVVVFLATACIVLLLGFRLTMLTRGLIPALSGFVAGGLPWWLWNLRYEWGSFDFAGTFGKVTLKQGCRSFAEQFLSLTGLEPFSAGIQKARLTLLLLALAAFVGIVIRDRLRRRDGLRFYYRIALPVLSTVMAAFYVQSHYARFDGASRYLMPLVPALAIMLGVVCARIRFPGRFPAGVLLLLAVLPPYTLEFRATTLKGMQAEQPLYERADKLADYLESRGGGTAVGDWVLHHWMNFASGERLRIAFLPTERYAPYAREAELADAPAVIGNFKRFRTFLATTAGTSVPTNVAGFEIDTDIAPPSDEWQYVNLEAIVSVTDHTGTPAMPALTDLCLDTTWTGQVTRHTNAVLTFEFPEAVPVCGIRFLSPSDRYPPSVTVEAGYHGDTAWHTLMERQQATCFFWSGASPKVDGMQYFQEFRFPAATGQIERLAIRFDAGDRRIPRTFVLSEVRLLAQGPSRGSLPDAAACVQAVQQHGIRRLYAPRWLAGRMWTATGGTLDVTVPGNLRRSINSLTVRDKTLPEPVTVKGNTGFICDVRDAAASRQALNSRGLAWRETPLGRYVLLTVPAPAPTLEAARLPTLYWTELGCFGADIERLERQAAAR